MNYYLDVWRKYADFSGRARRKEYWMFTLLNAVVTFGIFIVDTVIGTYGVLMGLYGLAVVIPSLAVFFRRLHDTGRSGWWWLIGVIPFIGGIVLFVFMVLDSQPGDNKYGPNPKGISAPATPAQTPATV